MPDRTALETVLEQVRAFNARDLDRFIATYAPEARVVGVGPDPVEGREALRAFYGQRFADPDVSCSIDDLLTLGDQWVVAREQVHSAMHSTETMATFQVRHGVIVAASMVKTEPQPRNP